MLRFTKFCIVGFTGAIITFGITYILTEYANLWYMASLIFATTLAMISNFTFNNIWTFKDRQELKAKPTEYNYDWEGYYNGSLIQKWWKQTLAKKVWQFTLADSKLLDIGCGSSPIIGGYKNATGIDLNGSKIAFIKSKYPELRFMRMDAENLEFGDNSFDSVLCIELVEHLKNPKIVISEIARVLKESGVAVIATPDYGRPWWYLAELFTPTKQEHVYKFTRKKLKNMCKEFGLELLDYDYVAGCDLIAAFGKVNGD